MGQPRSQPKGEAEEERDISVVILLFKRRMNTGSACPIHSGCFVLGTDSISSQFMHE